LPGRGKQPAFLVGVFLGQAFRGLPERQEKYENKMAIILVFQK
jgi:hypothetical protein